MVGKEGPPEEHTLRLAPETASGVRFDVEITSEERIPDTLLTVARPGSQPKEESSGSGEISEGGSGGGRKMGRREFLTLLGGGAFAGGAYVVEKKTGFFGNLINKVKSGGDGKEVVPDPSPGPTATIENTATATPTQTETPSSTPTNTPEETNTPVPETPGYGKYESIDEAPFSEARKNAIKELTKDCEAFIITDHGMLVIEHALQNRPSKIQHEGFAQPAAQLHSAELDMDRFPDAVERFDKALGLAKFSAWKAQNNQSNATFEEYKASIGSVSHPFEVWGYEGTSNTKAWKTLSDDAFLILKYVAGSDKTDYIATQASEVGFEVIGDVVAANMFDIDPAGEGLKFNDGSLYSDYKLASTISYLLSGMSSKPSDSIIGGSHSLSYDRDMLIDIAFPIRETLIEGWDGKTSNGIKQIFRVTGTKLAQ